MAQLAAGMRPLRRSFSEHVKDSTNRAWDVFWRGVRERRLWGESETDVGAEVRSRPGDADVLLLVAVGLLIVIDGCLLAADELMWTEPLSASRAAIISMLAR